MDEVETPYQVQSVESTIQVVDGSGRVVLNFGDRANAEQYAAMLNQAFERGFKAGYRAARQKSPS
jgi:hypothetical protein